ncbi:glycosyl hydrolase family 18 protein [Roseateles sp. DC23W]|uniref:chitinase n=1 Tax=Pelomonas dachongensis TaxID=3299029 RepID=A0ABW7ES71_9BURK
MRVLHGVLFLTLLAACQPHRTQTRCQPIVAVYPSWKQQVLPPAEIPWQQFTHLALVFALPTPEGGLDTRALDDLVAPLVAEAHRHRRRVVVSIGGAQGYGDAFQRIAASPERSRSFATAVRDYVARHRLDGVDIDWEYWTRQARDRQGGNDPVESRMLVELLAALRSQLPKDVLLTTSVFAGPWMGEQYLPELQQHVDLVALMSFDFTGRWDASPVGHHADWSTFKQSVQFLVDRGFARDKILAGVPFYGKQFAGGANRAVSNIAWRDRQPGQAHAFFETPELAARKAQYVVDEGLAGLMAFELSMDAPPDSPASLLGAVNRHLSPALCRSKD